MQGTGAAVFIDGLEGLAVELQSWGATLRSRELKMKNSFRLITAIGFLISLSWTSVCVLQAQQSGSTTAEQNLKFQPQLVTKTVSVFNPPARGAVTVTLKGTDLSPNASGQAKLKMGDVDVRIEAQADGLRAPDSFGSQFETYLVWAITPAGKTFKLGAMEAKGSGFELDTKSAVRSFAIVVTAEPYEQVTRPADTIVLEVPAGGQTVPANCEFLKEGYAPVGYQFPPDRYGCRLPSANSANVQCSSHRDTCRRREERQFPNGRRVVQLCRLFRQETKEIYGCDAASSG